MAQSADLVEVSVLNPAVVFGDKGAGDVIAQVKAEAVKAANGLDVSTEMGRKALASVAYKVARSKTALDEMGKNLAAELRARTSKIDSERKRIRDELDEVKDQVRAPLTEWEQTEERRLAGHETAIQEIEQLAVFVGNEQPTVTEIDARLGLVAKYEGRDWQEFVARGSYAIGITARSLRTMKENIAKQEAERAEYERLRAEEVARQQKERDERIAAEAQAAAERKVSAERAAAEKRARDAEAAQKRAEQERKTAQEQAARAEVAKIAAQDRAKADAKAAAEKAAQRERDRIEAERAKEAAAAQRREDSERNRRRVAKAIQGALEKAGLTPQQAALAFDAMADDKVPHVKIEW